MQSPPSHPESIEPLQQLARFTFDWAPALCQAGHGCMDYHRAWSMLRLLDLDGAPPAGWAFFQRELHKLDPRTPLRVLISGGADTGMMSIVAAALRPNCERLQIVFSDRCETSLEQNRLFARHLGQAAEFHLGDIRLLHCQPVDAIVAHTFLPFFDEAQRYEVAEAWSRNLKPGGLLLLSNRLTDTPLAQRPPPDEAMIRARLPILVEKARALGWSAQDLDTVADLAQRFWRQPARPTITETQMRDYLRHAGLILETIEYDDNTDPTGPLSRRHRPAERKRAYLLARKPPHPLTD